MNILPQKVTQIPRPFLVVCEGYADICFVDALLTFRGISNCNVGCPSVAGGSGNGRDAIPAYLKSIQTAVQLKKAQLNGLALIVDADNDATASFNTMVRALQEAAFPVPTNPFTLEGQVFRVGIFLIPGKGKQGCLEHILWDAVIQRSPLLAKCVDDFSICAGDRMRGAPLNSQAKMRMSAVVAASCVSNPWASAGLMWRDTGNPVPINSNRFIEVGDFLMNFVA